MKTEISEKPILFSGPMVRAILDGRKTMTRRVIKCHCNTGHITGNLLGEWGLSVPPHQWNGDVDEINWRWRGEKPQIGDWIEQFQTDVDDHDSTIVRCPYGKPGDRLWVRETFSEIPDQKPSGYFTDPKWINRKYWYAADNDKPTWGGKWKPSIFMPRDACRILLEITDIRVERLQEITEEDAIAEGFVAGDGHPENGFHTESPYPAVAAFRSLWDQLNGNRGVCKTCKGHGVVPAWSGSVEGGSLAIDSRDCPDCKGEDKSFGWDQNPFVWVIEFKRIN